MKLTYWYRECLHDSDVYSIREKTKKEALRVVDEHCNPEDYGPPIKVTVEYDDGFDLMKECSGEGGRYWEAVAVRKLDREAT